MYNSLWYSGAIIAAWTTFGTFKIKNTWSWRIPSVLQGLPAIAQVCLVWFAPESPRWLVGKGRDQEALETLAYYHADGNKDDPLVRYEFEEIKSAIDFDKNVVSNVGWSALWKTRGNRKRMGLIIAIAFFSQWVSTFLSTWSTCLSDSKCTDSLETAWCPTTSTWSSILLGLQTLLFRFVADLANDTMHAPELLIRQLLINGILQIWNLCWALFASAMVDKIGRRVLFISSCIGMLVFFILQTVCSALYVQKQSDAAAHAVIAFIFLFYASYE